MKKIFNNPIFMFVLGALVCGCVGTVAANAILSSEDITFTSGNNWQAANVHDALDDLYAARVPSNYSTEERVIGKWIDNKPLYQKVVPLSLSGNFSRGWNNNVAFLAENIDTVVSLTLNSKRTNYSMLFYSVSNSGYLSLYQETTDTYGKPAFAIIKFTKTTDSGTD